MLKVKKNISIIFIAGFIVAGFLYSANVLAHENHDENIIIFTDEGYSPKDIEIERGQAVIFKNESSKDFWPASNIHPTHRGYPDTSIDKCGTADTEGVFDACRGISPGESFEFIFKHPGTWKYHDHLSPSFGGTVEVTGELNQEQGPAEEPLSFFEKLKAFLSKIKGFIGDILNIESWSSQNNSVSEYNYNKDITEGARNIFSDDDALFSHIKKFGPAATTQALHGLSAQYGDCHNRAHEAGRIAYEVEGARAFTLCSAECHSGCYHGATEAYFNEHGTANIDESISTVCNSELNSFFSHQCIHGVGHGLMAWSNYDIFDALNTCDTLPRLEASCWSGVYMENIVGGLASDNGHTTEYLSEDPHFPCTVVEDRHKAACYYYQTSRMVQLFKGDLSKVADECASIEEEYQASCFLSFGRDVSSHHRGNAQAIFNECSHVEKGDNRTRCLSGAVQDGFWDKSGKEYVISFCRALEDENEKNVCYSTISLRATQVLDNKKEFRAFCESLENEYTDKCYGLEEYLQR